MSMWEMLYIISELLSWKHFIVRSFTDTRSNLKWLESFLMTILFTRWAKFVVTLRHLVISWTCFYTVLQYTFVIFLSFLKIKKCTKANYLQETGWTCWLLKSVFCSPSCFCPRQFSTVSLSSNSLLLWWQNCHCFSQCCSCFLRAKSVYHDVRGKDLFTCLLLSLLAAQFPASLFCYSESLCHFAQKWIIRKKAQ